MGPTAPRALASLVLAGSLLACGRAAAPPGDEQEDELTSAAGSCGVERWAVKTGTDSTVGNVNFTPQDTTIAALRARTAPSPIPAFTRAAPVETTTFKLTNVTLLAYKLENDSDIHLVLREGAATDCAAGGTCMIAEIPDSSCVGSGSPFADGAAAARAAFASSYTASGTFQFANVPVTLIGVGMFDFLHGQFGVAPNGIELHSVLGICFGTDCTIPGTAPDAGTPDSGVSGTPDSGVSGAPDSGVSGGPDGGASCPAGQHDRGDGFCVADSPASAHGAGCSSASVALPWLLAAAALLVRRRR
jgi:uncharacterized protein (TIGR03382 family)